MIACPGFSPRVRLGGRPVPVYLAITTSFRAVRVFLRVFCISRRFLCAFGKERGQLMGLSYFFSLTVCEVADLSRRAHPQPFGDPFSGYRPFPPPPPQRPTAPAFGARTCPAPDTHLVVVAGKKGSVNTTHLALPPGGALGYCVPPAGFQARHKNAI